MAFVFVGRMQILIPNDTVLVLSNVPKSKCMDNELIQVNLDFAILICVCVHAAIITVIEPHHQHNFHWERDSIVSNGMEFTHCSE